METRLLQGQELLSPFPTEWRGWDAGGGTSLRYAPRLTKSISQLTVAYLPGTQNEVQCVM